MQQPERLQKIWLGEDNPEVVFKMKEDTEAYSRSVLGDLVRTFEVYLEKGKNMAIQFESESSRTIYHNATSSLINFDDGKVSTVTPLEEGDVLAFVCSFFNEGDIQGDGYSIGRFLHNGDDTGIQIKMKGKTVRPVIYQDPVNAIVHASLGSGNFKNKEGNIYK